MNKLALALAISVAASTSFAGGLSEPMVETEVIVADTAGTSGGILIPILLLLLIAVAISGNDPAPQNGD